VTARSPYPLPRIWTSRPRGLGLAITFEVCNRIGWTLAFTSLEPRGLLVQIRGSG
jgi:hypothetical protein